MKDLENNLWTKIPSNKTPATTPVDERFWEYLKKGDKILEVGCGWGRIMYEGVKRGFKLTGIDINKNEVEELKKRIKNDGLSHSAIVYNRNILSVRFKGEFFRGALMQGVLSTLDKNQRSKCLSRIKIFLSKGGYIHIAEFKLNDKFRERYEKDFLITKEYGTLSVKDERDNELYRSHNFTEKEILSLIKDNGFKIISIKRVAFISYHGNKKPGMMIIAKK